MALPKLAPWTPEDDAASAAALPALGSFAPGETPDEPLQEMHPALGEVDRAAVKNLSPADAAASLDKLGFEVKHRGGNAFSIRQPGEREWRVVDPDTGFFSKDILRDAGDLLGDVVSGTGAALGGALGGTSGSVVPGAGTLAGVATGGAAGGALTEGVKQGLLKLGGYEVSPGGAAGRVGEEALYGAGGELLEKYAIRPAVKFAKGKLGGVLPSEKLAKTADDFESAKALAESPGFRSFDELQAMDAPTLRATVSEIVDAPRQASYDVDQVRELIERGAAEADTVRSAVDETFEAAEKASGKAEAATEKVRVRAEELRAKTAELKSAWDTTIRSGSQAQKRAANQAWKKSKEALDKVEAKLADAESTSTYAAKDAADVAPGAGEVSYNQNLNTIAKQHGVAPSGPGRAPDAVLADLTETLNSPDYAARSAAKTLGMEDAFAKTDSGEYVRAREDAVAHIYGQNEPRLRQAFGDQIKGTIDALPKEAPFRLTFTRRTSKPGAPRGTAQTMRAAKGLPGYEEGVQGVRAELADLSLTEAQDVLLREGWKGDPGATLDDVAQNLFDARKLNMSGAGSPKPDDLHQLVDLDAAEYRRPGIRESLRLDVEGGAPPPTLAQRAAQDPRVRAADDAARSGLRTLGRAGAAVGGVLEAPWRAARRGAEKVGEAMQHGAGGKLFGERRGQVKRGLQAVAKTLSDDAARHGRSTVADSIQSSLEALGRTNVTTRELNSTREALKQALKAAEPGVDLSAEAREGARVALQKLSKLGEVSGPTRVLTGQTMAGVAGFGAFSGMAPALLAGTGLTLLGKGLRRTALTLSRDTTGQTAAGMLARGVAGAARPPEKVALLLQSAIKALEARGIPAYQASINTAMHSADFRHFLSQVDEEE